MPARPLLLLGRNLHSDIINAAEPYDQYPLCRGFERYYGFFFGIAY
jgi:hypothetical protein